MKTFAQTELELLHPGKNLFYSPFIRVAEQSAPEGRKPDAVDQRHIEVSGSIGNLFFQAS